MSIDQLQPGIYQIHSYASGTALDLSGGDLKSILGFPAHEGANQKWELAPLGKGYSIRSAYSGDYLTVEDGLSNSVPIVASPYPVSWALAPIHDNDRLWNIIWPNTKLAIGVPNTADDTLARLVEVDGFGSRSRWRFILQKSTPDTASASHPSPNDVPFPVSSNAATKVKMGEDGDLTITTTTTTITTTSTKVVKTQM